MWLGIIIAAQLLIAPLPGGEQDLAICTAKGPSPPEQRTAACSRVTDAHALDDRQIASAYAILGVMTNDPALAVGYYDKAIARVTDEADYYASRGHLYGLLGNGRAHADFERGLALKPGHFNIFVFRALTYKRQGDDARALADLDAAIALDPRNYVPYYVKKRYSSRAGRLRGGPGGARQGSRRRAGQPRPAIRQGRRAPQGG
ncbi:MAG: hypothetical protein WDN31_01650 [Hyphomicrobium sp.]